MTERGVRLNNPCGFVPDIYIYIDRRFSPNFADTILRDPCTIELIPNIRLKDNRLNYGVGWVKKCAS